MENFNYNYSHTNHPPLQFSQVKGTDNNMGANNCFLNAAFQSLMSFY